AKSLKSGTKDEVLNAYRNAKNRLLILDYDGTLVGFKKVIEQAYPDEELYQVLDQLSSNNKNHLAIISGRNHETMEHWFGSKKYSLSAEHGAWSRSNQGGEQIPGLSNAWKGEVRRLMDAFSDSRPGCFVEEKSYSLLWHYRKVRNGLAGLGG